MAQRSRTCFSAFALTGCLVTAGCAMLSSPPPRSVKAQANKVQAGNAQAKPAPISPPATSSTSNPAPPNLAPPAATLTLTHSNQPNAPDLSRPPLRLNSLTGLPVGRPPTSEPGGDAPTLTQVSFATQGGDYDPDVSRNATHIVFSSTQHSPNPDIYIKAIDSRVVTRLTSGGAQHVMPKFSPDATRIAFASDRGGNWDIYIMPVSGGKAIQVTSTPTHELHPSWSPDGQSLVFCRLGEISGQWELWITSAHAGGATTFIGYGMFPQWCPRPGMGEGGADRILFQRPVDRGDRAFSIWTLDYREGQAWNATEVASSPTAACINPAWSPDGQWIVFTTVPLAGSWPSDPGARPPWAELWMADLSGTARVRLTSGPSLALSPAWGTDNRLFFVSNRARTDTIWSLDVSHAVRLASGWRHAPAEMVRAAEDPADR